MFGSKKKAREEEGLRRQAEEANRRAIEAAQKVETPDPFETRRRERIAAIDDWRSGKSGAVDIRAMPGGAVPMALFEDAKRSRDAGRIGRGMGVLADGANPNFAAALDKEMQLERDLSASGQLEGQVDQTLAGVDEEMYGLANMGNSRTQYLAELARALSGDANNKFIEYRKSKSPGFLKSLALGAVGNLSFSKGGLTI